MGYRVFGICYTTTSDALEGFNQTFPLNLGNSGIHALVSSSINSTGLVTYTYKPPVGGNSTLTSQLSTCTAPTLFKDTPLRDISQIDAMVFIAFIFAILLGFGHGMNLKGFGK